MTLTGSGQISFNDIRVELNVPSQSPFTLGESSRNIYATIQQCQTPFPSSTNPDSISEWYGYNHSATASLTINEASMDYTSSNCTDACNALAVGNDSLQAYTRDSSNYYGDATCIAGLTAGYYADNGRVNCYTVVGSPASITISACGSTTTTTTTTTTAPGTCYRVVNSSGVNTPTLDWTSYGDGIARSGSAATNTTYQICSTTSPTERGGAVDLTITTCSPADSCTNTCTVITCKGCSLSC
jgi:hypothetical protein